MQKLPSYHGMPCWPLSTFLSWSPAPSLCPCFLATLTSLGFTFFLSNLPSILLSQSLGTCSARVSPYRSLHGSLLPSPRSLARERHPSSPACLKIATSFYYSLPYLVYFCSWLTHRPAPNIHKTQSKDANRDPRIRLFTSQAGKLLVRCFLFSYIDKYAVITTYQAKFKFRTYRFLWICTRKQGGWASSSQTGSPSLQSQPRLETEGTGGSINHPMS